MRESALPSTLSASTQMKALMVDANLLYDTVFRFQRAHQPTKPSCSIPSEAMQPCSPAAMRWKRSGASSHQSMRPGRNCPLPISPTTQQVAMVLWKPMNF